MEIGTLMSSPVISVREDESAALAAQLLSRNNIGALPVCSGDGRIVGMVTDRDLVTRCMALGASPEETCVEQVMSGPVTAVDAHTPVREVSWLMGAQQVRRVPVTDGGKLTGIVSLADLARAEVGETAMTLEEISDNVSRR